MTSQVVSNCHHSRPWRAENSNAWWLLCHPSPKARAATTPLLRLRSPVAKGWEPQTWAAELTSHVMW